MEKIFLLHIIGERAAQLREFHNRVKVGGKKKQTKNEYEQKCKEMGKKERINVGRWGDEKNEDMAWKT